MDPKITIQDIARLAGVSMSTVSRVLNQSDYVGAETRERVMRIVEQYQFVPSLNAKGLKGHNYVLGLLIPAVSWTAILDVMWSVSGYISQRTGYNLMFYSYQSEQEYLAHCQQVRKTGAVAGLLTMAYDQPLEPLVALYKQGLPVVFIDTVSTSGQIPRIGADQYGGGYAATQHLIELGHRRIAHIQGPPMFGSSLERYQGYRAALADANLEFDPSWLYVGNFQQSGGFQGAETLLHLAYPPTAIFAANDTMAYGALHYARKHGIRVPEDVSVIGFNDDVFQDYGEPYLSTVRQPFTDMGKCAVDLILSLLDTRYTFPSHWHPFLVSPIARKSGEIGESTVPEVRFPTPVITRATTSQPTH